MGHSASRVHGVTRRAGTQAAEGHAAGLFVAHGGPALAGLGITGLPSFVAEEALLENALERVLPQWHMRSNTLYAGMPTRKHVPARTRAFVDFLVATFGGEDRDPWLIAAGCETIRLRDQTRRAALPAAG